MSALGQHEHFTTEVGEGGSGNYNIGRDGELFIFRLLTFGQSYAIKFMPAKELCWY